MSGEPASHGTASNGLHLESFMAIYVSLFFLLPY
ncbi:hypothetical protein SLEP1_g32738 [Rubroshorea leprosula]|uniref:Uncharacterized protein n=1 Tax=Rubroshorea leprosula TaxID=152421 RepID=A0AAV5KEF3_9ROSI|nr:hypothetical protein SLEP1_g32738 [Rubroshorea leprosula]